jgi:hypothetical protein
MRIQSIFRHLLVLLVFCMPLGVLGMMDPAGRDAWTGHIDTDSDDDAGEATSSEEEGPGVSKHGSVTNVSPAVPATGAKGGWTLGISTEDLETAPRSGSSSQYPTSVLINSQVVHGNSTNASQFQPIRVGDARESIATSQNAGGWTLGVKLDYEDAQPRQKKKSSTLILQTTDPNTVYVVQSNVGTHSQIITRATISSSTSSSQSNTNHGTSRSLAPLDDSDDDSDDVAFTEGFRPLSGRGKPNKTQKSKTNRAEAPTRYLPSFTGLPTGALGETQPNQNQRPAGRPAPSRATHPDQAQPQVHRFSVHIGVPLQVIIPVLACALVAGWLIKKWYAQPAVVEDEVEPGASREHNAVALYNAGKSGK